MTADEINALFATYDIVEVPTGVSVAVAPEATAMVNVDSGKTLNIREGGTLSLGNSASIINGGTLDVQTGGNLTVGLGGSVVNSGTMTVSGNVLLEAGRDGIDDGAMSNEFGGTVRINSGGTVANDGQIFNGGQMSNSGIIQNNGTLQNGHMIRADTTASLTNDSSGIIQGNGYIYSYTGFTNNGKIEGELSFYNAQGGTVTNTATGIVSCRIYNEAEVPDSGTQFNNAGQIQINKDQILINGGTLINDVPGSIVIAEGGTVSNLEGSYIINNGTITNHGTINNKGTITNNGTYHGDNGKVVNDTSGILDGTNPITNYISSPV